MIKSQGKVEALVEAAYAELEAGDVDLDREFSSHVGIAHTRWATHGAPSARNSHPQSSDAAHEWLVVHNGIITNWKPLKDFLVRPQQQRAGPAVMLELCTDRSHVYSGPLSDAAFKDSCTC